MQYNSCLIMGFSANKLRVNLKLVINRLKLLEKKKTEIAQKARKEIADYLAQSKDDRARIRVEHIIREDYLVEAMELLELYADLLLARFGLIETMKYCEDGLCEAVSTLIWAAPRLQSECKELRVVADQLGQKYGKQFAQQAAGNTNRTVNERLITKLSPNAPPKALVENYLIEIAKSHNVPFEPDQAIMEGGLADIDESKSFGGDDNSNFNGNSGFSGSGGNIGGSGGGGGGGSTQIGFERFNNESPSASFPQMPSIPQMPSVPGQNTAMAYPPPQVNPPYVPPPNEVSLPPPSQPGYPSNSEKQNPGPGFQLPSSPKPPPTNTGSSSYPVPPPVNGSMAPPNISSSLPNVPDLPDVPSGSLPGGGSTVGGATGGDDLDFDDLNRRFEELKKKK